MISPTNITIDVYAQYSDTYPRYRVFLDDDLMTERDFIWQGHEIFIRENIIANLGSGDHVLRVENVSTSGSIKGKNIMVNGVPSAAKFTIA